METQLDLTQNPGWGECDRCERRAPLEWLGCFCLCDGCVNEVAQTIGKNALGRAIERVAELYRAQQELRNLSLRKGA